MIKCRRRGKIGGGKKGKKESGRVGGKKEGMRKKKEMWRRMEKICIIRQKERDRGRGGKE